MVKGGRGRVPVPLSALAGLVHGVALRAGALGSHPILRLIIISLSSLPLLTLEGACLVLSDGAAMTTAVQSAADSGPNSDVNSAKGAMQ